MKKILQICAIDVTFDAFLKPLIHTATQKGYLVHNACSDTGKFVELRKQGLHMIEIPIERKISPWANIKSVIKLYTLMKKEKYDIVHVHTPIAAVLGRIAARLAGVPSVVYTAHGFYFHEGMSKFKYALFFSLEKFLAALFTDWLLLVSKEDYRLCAKHKFKNKERILHICDGVDIYHKFNPKAVDGGVCQKIKKELAIGDKDIVLTFIGRLVREKGIFELLEAFGKLKENRPGAKLLVVGDILVSERDQQSYKLIIKKLEDRQIIWTGFRKDIPELLAVTDIFILPSYREGLPRTIIEAMAMGKPIIATNIRGCNEEVDNNKNGFLIAAGSSMELFERMALLYDDCRKREIFGRCSRQIAEERFDEAKVVKKQLELFDKLCSLRGWRHFEASI